ncbi:MAG: hypothetical protein KKH01_02220 [Firmicutes bacterium]|nr:hypothetical protein [Bacillota bacterium]
MTRNKEKDIANLRYTSLKTFNFNKLNEFIHLDDLMILTNADESNQAKRIKSVTVDQNIERLKCNKSIWNILLFDLYNGDLNEENLTECLINNKISIFIDINLSENEVQVLINLKRYSYEVISAMREKLVIDSKII